MSYKHGVYGVSEASNYKSETSIGTLPVYIGSMPIQRININGAAEYDYSAYINKPILISSYKEVRNLGIYSDDWSAYTLGEAIRAHFMNSDEVMAPIVLINVLDPTSHVGESAVTKTVPINKEGKSYVGYIDDPLCSLDEMTITADGVQFAEGEVTYAYDGDAVKISISKTDLKVSSISATYKQISFKASDVRATAFETAVNAVDDVEAVIGLLPTILCAPEFSKIPENHDIMIQKAIDKAAQKWNLVCVTDIPASADVNTKELAIAWKKTNQYNSKYEKVCYPKVANGDHTFHLSTMATFRMMLTDAENDNIPYVSPSNKILDVDRAVLDDGTSVFFKEYEANELNAAGITTINFVKQRLRLWGPHMANYDYASLSSIKPEDRFDLQIRMLGYILNYLQYNHTEEIDESFTPSDRDSVINSAQTWLDSLVALGALLYARISFDTTVNDTESLENGDLIFDLDITYPINAKSITFRGKYTRTGVVLLLTEEGDE